MGNECALTAQGQIFNNIPEFKYDTRSAVLAPYLKGSQLLIFTEIGSNPTRNIHITAAISSQIQNKIFHAIKIHVNNYKERAIELMPPT